MTSSKLRRAFVAAACCVPMITPAITMASTSPSATATGSVISMENGSSIETFNNNGVISSCEIWNGRFKTKSGQVFNFSVETPVSNTQPPVPADPNAVKVANTLTKNLEEPGLPAPILNISYTPSELDCNVPLKNVVTSATVIANAFPTHNPPVDSTTKTLISTGTLKSLSAPSRISQTLGNGTIKRGEIWRGVLFTSAHKTVRFNVETGLRENFNKTKLVPTNSKVTLWIKNLRKAKKDGQKASVTIKYKASETVLGKTRKNVANGVSVKF